MEKTEVDKINELKNKIIERLNDIWINDAEPDDISMKRQADILFAITLGLDSPYDDGAYYNRPLQLCIGLLEKAIKEYQ
jgi:hypothetical protein